ncbi:hypothetical protein N0V93_005862 [Gnomoniopsis smithogilvyi]|uniref:Single-strand DNA deaminase toxin A-like C-terminal domain-containing protein n=1 Tax=Gnomoniopsis smithogilvyi TaxID=1191159 RepID=A0A9W9CX37_9PEZI|nr:hypothetical protein N0V93_005862 [Gnomoniopsis smithogilvyi]
MQPLSSANTQEQKVRALIASKEHAIDQRTTTGATALMLASLYGRSEIFIYLLYKSASVLKQDFEGSSCKDYVRHMAFTKPLLETYEVVATEKPRRSGRKIIYGLLRSFSSANNQGCQRRSEKVETLPVGDPPAEALHDRQPERRVVSLRKNGVFELGEFRSLALAEWPFKLGRKTCAAVRASNEVEYKAIAISGWRGDEAVQVVNVVECVNNASYFKLTRDLAKIVGFKFKNWFLDGKYEGTPSEKAGAFHTCHAEKQLAVFVLMDSMASVLGTSVIDLDSLAKLKLAVKKDATTIQKEFVIELEHKPCLCCIAFLQMIFEKSGLHLEWLQRDWFVEGKRPQLRPQAGLEASPKDSDTVMDVIDAAEDDWQLVPDPDFTLPAAVTPGNDDKDDDDDDDDENTDDSWVVVRHPRPQKPRRKRDFEYPTKAGSEVDEEDYPFTNRQNISKRLLLKQKRRQKTVASHQFAPSSDTLNSDTNSPQSSDTTTASTVGSSSQATKGRITPVKFVIPIPTTGTSAAHKPFPNVTDFMSRWGFHST